MIAIVDYGAGNVGSIRNMFRKLGVEATITADPEAVARAARIVLPGVGAFGPAAQRLRASGMIEALERRVRGDGAPFLGICLGMQLMLPASEEGPGAGLGWIPGRVRRFAPPAPLKVPHMGWNGVDAVGGAPLFSSEEPGRRYYFVHSFFVECADETHVAGWTQYGGRFASAVSWRNLHGVQFHPEKSHRFGLRLLDRFAKLPA